ncbi:MAG: putative helix-turn-helix domain protein [Frankiales bacterium]|nr:putative helix-turn-helix domain protein [Frankiales bacterium]
MEATAALAQTIGSRVRQHRQARGWTLDQLAEAADVSRRALVNIEQGTSNPSIGILLKLSDALGVGLPELVEPAAPTALVTVTRSGEGSVLWQGRAGGRAVLVAGTKGPDVVELWDWTLGAGERYASDAHTVGTRELLQVLEGSVQVEVAEDVTHLEAGDAASFPGDVAHAYANPGGRPARFSLAVLEPAVGRARSGAGRG